MWLKVFLVLFYAVIESTEGALPPALFASLLGGGGGGGGGGGYRIVTEVCEPPPVKEGTDFLVSRKSVDKVEGIVTCKTGYVLEDNVTSTIIPCADGKWNGTIPGCTQRCGASTVKTMKTDVSPVYPAQVPWHVAVYNRDLTPYNMICGGSIVSEQVVLTVASCFWTQANASNDRSRFIIAAGKKYQQWNHKSDAYYTQKTEIKDIKYPYLYLADTAKYQEDIAVVIVKTPFVFNNVVSPICIKLDPEFTRPQEKSDKLGLMVGWGLGADDDRPLYRMFSPYMTRKACNTNTSNRHFEYYSRDKICAGKTSGNRLCAQDRGNSYAFMVNGTYYLRGIITTWGERKAASALITSGPCTWYKMIYMTDVAAHRKFLSENLSL